MKRANVSIQQGVAFPGGCRRHVGISREPERPRDTFLSGFSARGSGRMESGGSLKKKSPPQPGKQGGLHVRRNGFAAERA